MLQDQLLLTGRHLETKPFSLVRGAAVVRAFQTDGGESDGRAVFLHYLSREPCGGVRAVMSGMRTMGLGGGRLKAEGQHDRQKSPYFDSSVYMSHLRAG